MFRVSKFVIFFMLFWQSLFSDEESYCKYDLSICAMFQNEAEYLKEWIEYHRLLGVQRFYLYNNNSTDNYEQVLKPYIKEGIVELTNWPSPPDLEWIPYQKKAYNHCIGKTTYQTRWLAIIDVDEFIVPHKHNNLLDFLKTYENMGGVMISWQFFGTNGLKSIPSNQLMIESLTKKAFVDHVWNRNYKCIVKPHRVKKYLVHGGYYISGYHAVTTRGYGGVQPPIVDEIQINHYWTRAEDWWWDVKVPRRTRYVGKTYTVEESEAIFASFNKISDTSILRFVPDVKKKITMGKGIIQSPQDNPKKGN